MLTFIREKVSIMGANNSTPAPVEEKEIPVGEGTFGKVFKKGKYIIKRFKYDESRNDFLKELTFYGWINSLKNENEQSHFCKLITHSVYYDETFYHIPEYFEEMDDESKKMIEKSNKSKWTVDLVLEYKGRPLKAKNIESLSLKEKYEKLIQILIIVEIMKRNHVFHEDIYPPNFVINEDNGQISLIDYGVTFLEGQRSVDKENSNTMLRQISNIMANFAAVIDAVADTQNLDNSYKPPTPKQTIEFLKKNDTIIYNYTISFIEKYGYSSDSFAAQAVGDNLLRVKNPDLHLKMYGLEKKLSAPFFDENDLYIIYDNWQDINFIINKFTHIKNNLQT